MGRVQKSELDELQRHGEAGERKHGGLGIAAPLNCRSKQSLATRSANGAGTPPAGGLNQLHLCVGWGRQTLYLLGVPKLVFRGDELLFFWEQIQIYW